MTLCASCLDWKMGICAHLWGVILIKFIDVGRPVLRVGWTSHWVGIYGKMGKAVEHSSIAFDFLTYDVTSCFELLHLELLTVMD